MEISGEFNIREVTRINNDSVITINSDHYIARFLSSYEISYISHSGLRYNLIKEITSQDMSNGSADAKVSMVPTGVINEEIHTYRPKAFRYQGVLIYENRDLLDNLTIYVGDIEVGEITEISEFDRLIIITRTDLHPQYYHESGRYPHNFDKLKIVQDRVQEFNTKLDSDSVGISIPKYDLVPSVFQIRSAHELNSVDAYIGFTEGGYMYKPIQVEFDQIKLPAFSNKYIQ